MGKGDRSVFQNLLPFRFNGYWLAPITGDEIIQSIRAGRPFESNEITFVGSFLCPNQCFWDLGANFGLYTVLAAKRVGPTGSVLAVEPDPRNRFYLRANVLLNRQWHVTTLSVALGDSEEEADFFSCTQGAYSGLKIAEVPGTIKKIKVEQTTLDKLAASQQWPPVDFLKMDVEGAELRVLNGGNKFFGEGPRPIVMCEFSDRRTIAFSYRASKIYDWLTVRKYHWFRLTDLNKLIAQPPREEYDYDNLIGCPGEKLHRLVPWLDQ